MRFFHETCSSRFALLGARRAARVVNIRRESALRADNGHSEEDFFSCLRVTTRTLRVAISNLRSSTTAGYGLPHLLNKRDEEREK